MSTIASKMIITSTEMPTRAQRTEVFIMHTPAPLSSSKNLHEEWAPCCSTGSDFILVTSPIATVGRLLTEPMVSSCAGAALRASRSFRIEIGFSSSASSQSVTSPCGLISTSMDSCAFQGASTSTESPLSLSERAVAYATNSIRARFFMLVGCRFE